MSICWHCYWGWPKVIADIYDSAVKKLSGDNNVLHFGPSHIVWEDENWKDHHIKFCLQALKEDKHNYTDIYSQEELEICKWSLKELLKIPYNQRDYEPKDYDEENPKDFPPPKDIVMIKR
jgi:hypothetical protein